jgi:UDP-2,3-diacylglucosamine pyrophosphatase LpxH
MNGKEENGNERYEQKIHKGLERSYALAKKQKNELNVGSEQARIVIFSDHHRGVRDGADDFMRCEKGYSAALGYYLELGYTLIVLGDAEELWECSPGPVVKSYRETLVLEAEFQKQGRYYRIYGNHDDYWEKASGVRKLLGPIFGSSLQIKENLRLLFDQEQELACELFLVHGHQGDYLSDQNRRFSKFIVRYLWRPFQRLTNIKLTTPAKDYSLRDKHSIAMYRWADKKKDLVLVAGHTHLPVFGSKDHIGAIEQELEKARVAGDLKRVAELRAEIELAKAREREQGGSDFSMLKPSYFNTGCCSFSDGDVTGIEIAEGQIKLVRWPDDAGEPKPKILAQTALKEVFAAVKGT